MIIRRLLILLCSLITAAKCAGTKEQINCKSIDEKKFRDLFVFSYSGGSKGLALHFQNGTKEKFMIEKCAFNVIETKYFNHQNQSQPKFSKNKVSLNGLDPCTRYDVKFKVQNLVTKKSLNYDTQVTTRLDDKITKVDLKADNFANDSFRLSWSTKKDECIVKYKIILRDQKRKVEVSQETTEKSVTFNNLTICTNYNVELIAMDDKGSSVKSVLPVRTLSGTNEVITNVTITANGSTAHVEWETPIGIDCVSGYIIQYSQEHCTDSTSCLKTKNITNPQTTSAKLERLPLAEKFSLQIYVNEVTSNRSAARHAKQWKFNNIDYDKFVVKNINEFRNSPTEMQLQWTIENYLGKLVKEYEVFHDGTWHTAGNNSIIALRIAACKKNYKIIIRCVSIEGRTGPNVTYETQFRDDAISLSAVENFEFKQTNDSVLFTFSTNELEKLCIKHYQLAYGDIIKQINDTRIEISQSGLLPCTTYDIEITPISLTDTAGASKNFEFTTSVFAPHKPKMPKLLKAERFYLEIETEINENDRQCISTIIELKCNDITVERTTVEISETKYNGTITGLSPFTNYSCSARVKNAIGASEWSDIAIVATKSTAPNPPENITFAISSNNSIEVRWDSNKVPRALFKVYLTLEETLFKVPDGCSALDGDSISNTTEQMIVVNNLVSYSKYSLKMTTENDLGKSEFSKVFTFNTLQTSPSKPRNISFAFNPPTDESKPSANLSWFLPCRPNGNIRLYTVTIHGTRNGFDDHRNMTASSTLSLQLNDLKPGYNYEVEIQAMAEKSSSDAERINFKVPSGIPLEEDLENWTTIGSTNEAYNPNNIDIFIRRGIFQSHVGDITGIAILLFSIDCSTDLPQPEFGYRAKLNDAMPSWYNQTFLECPKFYQQTDIMPNGLFNETVADNLNNFDVKLSLGFENCDEPENDKFYCNGPLKPKTKYGMMARVYTSEGFRDTKPVTFITHGDFMSQMSTQMIFVATTGWVIFLSLIIMICCCCCSVMKKQRKQKVKKREAAETVENLLSFTSYCVIDRNPVPRKNSEVIL